MGVLWPPAGPWIPLALPWSPPDLETNKKLPNNLEKTIEMPPKAPKTFPKTLGPLYRGRSDTCKIIRAISKTSKFKGLLGAARGS